VTREEVAALKKGERIFKAQVGQSPLNDSDRIEVEEVEIVGLGQVFASLAPWVFDHKLGLEQRRHPYRVRTHYLTRYSTSRVTAVERLLKGLEQERDNAYRNAKRADDQRNLAMSWLHLNVSRKEVR
jgi:hypothetical protein